MIKEVESFRLSVYERLFLSERRNSNSNTGSEKSLETPRFYFLNFLVSRLKRQESSHHNKHDQERSVKLKAMSLFRLTIL